jgi:glycosyltransferase involved in cell wall biosynthesis
VEQWQAVRIALVVTGGVDRSGREKVVPALLWFIDRIARGNDVVVYALRYHEQPCSYALVGATIHDLGRPSGIRRQYSRLVDRLRRDGPFDVIHGYWALPAGLATALAGRRLGIPSIVTLDSGELVAIPDIEYGLQRKWRQRLGVRMTLAWATHITVCSQYMQQLAHRHGVEPAVIPFGVDTNVFKPAPGTTETPARPARLVHVANLNPVKDQGTLLEAFRRVVDHLPDVHLDIAGEDTLGGAIHRLAERLGVKDHVTFHGSLPSDDVATLYRGADLLVISSRHEAANVAVLEAAASGVPVVGTSVGYVADWAPDRAVAVPTADPAALAGAILATLRNAAERERLARSAREWALAHDADWTARQFLDLYRSL